MSAHEKTDPPQVEVCGPTELRQLAGTVGNTRLVHLPIANCKGVYLKLEGLNPGRSIKDRIAVSILARLFAGRDPSTMSAIVDSSSGNFGIAMGWLCRAYGVPFVCVCDPNVTVENSMRLQGLGVSVEMVTQRDATGGYLLTRMARAQELADTRGWTRVNQYSNSYNPLTHYLSTGPELLRQAGAQIDAVFVPASTGGTLAGIGRFMRKECPRTTVIAVDGAGSVLFGGTPGPRPINGLGSSRRSEFVARPFYDEVAKVEAIDALTWCWEIERRIGQRVGGSSGAAVAAAVAYIRRRQVSGGKVICICPDHGDNYRSSIFNDGWLRQHGY